MADIFDDEDLGSLLEDDDLLSLLDTIQNKQDSGESDSGSGDADDPTAVLGVSEEAFQRLMGDIDLDELEKSIVANIADDIKVGIRQDKLEMVITKKFEQG